MEIYLIKCAYGRNEDDRVGIVKVRNPRMALAARAADIVKVPRYQPAVQRHVELMLRDAHRLDPGVEDIIYPGRSALSSPDDGRTGVETRAPISGI
jgi:hypothetical protein